MYSWPFFWQEHCMLYFGWIDMTISVNGIEACHKVNSQIFWPYSYVFDAELYHPTTFWACCIHILDLLFYFPWCCGAERCSHEDGRIWDALRAFPRILAKDPGLEGAYLVHIAWTSAYSEQWKMVIVRSKNISILCEILWCPKKVLWFCPKLICRKLNRETDGVRGWKFSFGVQVVRTWIRWSGRSLESLTTRSAGTWTALLGPVVLGMDDLKL